MMNKWSIVSLTLVSVLTLTSCIRGPIQTEDASVDYTSAASFPPLKKHADDASDETSNSSTVSQTVTATSDLASIDARIIRNKQGLPTLLIAGDVNRSWAYLDEQLQKANVTIYNRNQSAGLFGVACGDVKDEATIEKKSRWTFFNRKKRTIETEYCTLKATAARKRTTTVSMLSRQGNTVGGPYVDALFERILNN